MGNALIKAARENTNQTPFICIPAMSVKTRELTTRSGRAPRAGPDERAGGWGVCAGTRRPDGGPPGAVGALALGLQSRVPAMASQFLPWPVHAGAGRQSPQPSEKDGSVYFYHRDQVWVSAGSLPPVLCLTDSFGYFLEMLLRHK